MGKPTGDIFAGAKNLTTESFEILKILKNIDSDRQIIGTHNFINSIERMKTMFVTPIEAVHAFYSIIYFWDITSKVITNETGNEVRVLGYHGNKHSEPVQIHPHKVDDFKRFVESQYIFTNEGSGLTVDYYFSRFDEVLAIIAPDYVKQHGIFFTDANLSKFALWFAMQHFPGNIHEDYIVFDPAAGSGNLVSSWRGKLKHKIVSELQPDLLRTIERRMQADPYHTETGFTIIPKTTDGIGLNFLDKDAADYMQVLQTELQRKNIAIDKPLCFLLNPPYKNIREDEKLRESTESHYEIHPSILEMTGADGSKERYLSFISQIINISLLKHQENGTKSILLIFTPTSWLIPRVAFIPFRNTFDRYFKFVDGFIIKSNEFFKVDGEWPLAFTIWEFDQDDNRVNKNISIYDLSNLKRNDLNVFLNNDNETNKILNNYIDKSKQINISALRLPIKEILPDLKYEDGKISRQGMQNFYRSRNKEEIGKEIVSGFALSDDRHTRIKAPHGYVDGTYIGFMDDLSPVRIRIKNDKRYENGNAGSVWFRIDTAMKDVNKSKCFNGPTDNRSYCAYDIESAKATFTWFCITKALNGQYPVWANQYDIWKPNISEEKQAEWYALCFAFVLAENRCVVTKFEKDNPVKDAIEVFVDNPLCPTNRQGFWVNTLLPFINQQKVSNDNGAILLIESITELYRYWNHNYCKGQFLYNCGLHTESYFKYFNYPDFLTPYSGLIQIKKYAELQADVELLNRFSEIAKITKAVKQQLHNLLVYDFKYFD
jgi:hypothetical protein